MIKGFAQIPNSILWNPDLSFQAKGVWAYIKSKPPRYDFSAARMALETKESRKSILKALGELEKAKFLLRKKFPSGRVLHKVYPVAYTCPIAYEPPISFENCRELIFKSTKLNAEESSRSAQELIEQSIEAQIKRSDFALDSWIKHIQAAEATVPIRDS